MPQPIDFYFDFSSPYGYLASHKIDALGAKHGREVVWKPILLGAVFKLTGMAPLTTIPLKGDYVQRDFARFARLLKVAFKMPQVFPFSSIQAVRAFWWLESSDPKAAHALAQRLYDHAFSGHDISNAQAVAAEARAIGIDGDALLAGIETSDVKEKARAENDRAVARNVFGSPYIIVDGEPFWGADRLEQVDKWLETGGLVSSDALLLIALAGGYLLGSIPFGLVLTRLAGLGDIRKIGSGNIGATNVLRTGAKPLALAVLLLDSGKGAAAVLLAAQLGQDAGPAAGLGAVLGHLFPVWLGFRGGKGVATTLGALLALAWPVGLIACGVWLLVALTFRISSAAALTAVAATPIVALLMRAPILAAVALLIAGLVWYKHAANIGRLLKGTEPRLSLSRKTA